MKSICICGGGSLGHVIAGYLSSTKNVAVNVLTRHHEKWNSEIMIDTPDGKELYGRLNIVSSDPKESLSGVDIVLLCLPGFAIKDEILKIKPYVSKDTYVGTVFSSTGFFFEAMNLLGVDVPLWGFQRVPFIARINEYGRSAHLLGYKSAHSIAVERCEDKEQFRTIIESLFDAPVTLLNNYYEASLTNSNPLLHTSRLYTMFGGKNEGRVFSRMILFYEEWTVEAAQLLIDMDEEFFNILKHLPVSSGYLPRILDYYESHDAASLARKLSSIPGFKGITSPMIEVETGSWKPDFESRYFTEDFPHGLRYIWELAHRLNVDVPAIDKVYNWGINTLNR